MYTYLCIHTRTHVVFCPFENGFVFDVEDKPPIRGTDHACESCRSKVRRLRLHSPQCEPTGIADQASALTTWPRWFKYLRYLNHRGQMIKTEVRSVRFRLVHTVVNVTLILSHRQPRRLIRYWNHRGLVFKVEARIGPIGSIPVGSHVWWM